MEGIVPVARIPTRKLLLKLMLKSLGVKWLTGEYLVQVRGVWIRLGVRKY